MENTIEKNIRILLTDDSSTTRKSIAEILNDLGFFEIFFATDGMESLKAIEDADKEGKPFGLVLCDINMPALNGIEFLRKVRQTHPNLPIIMVTIESESKVVMEAVSLGANHYLLKPVTAEKIIDKMEKVLSRNL